MGYQSVTKVRTTWKPGAVSRTKQSFAKECNINNIVKKFVKTGALPVVDARPIYGDFSNVADYQVRCNQVNAVRLLFNTLPAEVRSKFKHDPANMLEFVMNPANNAESVKLGLLPKEVLPVSVPQVYPKPEDKLPEPVKDPATPPA